MSVRRSILLDEEDRYQSKFSELKRQMLHILYGLAIIYAVIRYDKMTVAICLSTFTFVGGILSVVLRKRDIPGISHFMEHFERPEVMDEFPGKGGIFFTAGVALVLLIFSRNIALASIAILTIGDATSHLLGAYIKKYHYSGPEKKKMIGGMFAGILAASLASIFFVDPFFGFIAASISLFVEYAELRYLKIDDNFYIPVLAALILFLLQHFSI